MAVKLLCTKPFLARGAIIAGLALGLAACGLGRSPDSEGVVTDPVVAASVNGRPIYMEDVRQRAVATGRLRDGEDLQGDSDAFALTLEDLIQARLFASEAERRGLDRAADVRRQLAAAREQVLANAIYEEIDQKANDPREIERLYRENTGQLGQGQEVHLRHIQFATRDAALAAKRRLDNGERFEALAFELSTDRGTAAEGGDMGFNAVEDLPDPMRQLLDTVSVGQIGGPVRDEHGWHLVRVEDRRERGVPSLETLRPRIVDWIRFQEVSKLYERLSRDARIERLRAPEAGVAAPGGEVTAPADRPAEAPTSPAAPAQASAPSAPPAVMTTPSQGAPPPFPFPVGPGGVAGDANPAPAAAPATAAQAPAATPAAPPAAPRPPRPRPQTDASNAASSALAATPPSSPTPSGNP